MIGTLIAVVIILGVVLLAIGIYDGRRFVVKDSVFETPKIKKDFTFAMISDLHNCSFGMNNCKIMEALEKAEPEAVLIAGDLLTSKEGERIDATVSLMQEMCKRWSVYYAMGNHETKLTQYPEAFGYQYDKFIEVTKHPHQHILRNKRIFLPDKNVEIIGLELDRSYYKRIVKKNLTREHLQACIGKCDDKKYQILLAHNPEYFEEYVDWGADLILSGHVHGGIMRLPLLGGVLSPSLRLFPKYDGGIYKKGNTTMLLSRGIGVHSIPLRFFNPGELHIVRVKACTPKQ